MILKNNRGIWNDYRRFHRIPLIRHSTNADPKKKPSRIERVYVLKEESMKKSELIIFYLWMDLGQIFI